MWQNMAHPLISENLNHTWPRDQQANRPQETLAANQGVQFHGVNQSEPMGRDGHTRDAIINV